MADNSLPKVVETALPAAAMENVTHVRVVSTDNSEKLPINNLTIAGTKVTVSVDGLSGTVDGAFGDVLTAIAGKADTTQVEALDAEKVDKTQSVIAGNGMTGGGALSGDVTLNVIAADDSLVVAADSIKVDTVDALNSTSTTKPLSAAQGKAVNDRLVLVEAGVYATAPEVDFYNRVTADSGTIRSTAFMQRVFEANKDLLADTELLFVPEAGMKVTDGKIEKLYNLVGTNDAVQATAGNRPYVSGVIADGEKAKIKVTNGMSSSSLFINNTSFLEGDSWTLIVNLKLNTIAGEQSIFLGSSRIAITSSSIFLTNGTDAILTCNYTQNAGSSISIEFRYSNGNGVIVINGVNMPTSVEKRGITFGSIIFDSIYIYCCEINKICLISKAISVSESKRIHDFLSTEFPAIEAIPVGSQQIATSNLEATVFGAVSVPEVQDNSAWAALTTPAWSHSDNSPANGAIYGKLYNGYAVPVINTYAPKGFHVPSELEWTQLSESLGGNAVSGGKLKAKYGGFDNAFATNESGVSLLESGIRLIDGSFYSVDYYGWATDGRSMQALVGSAQLNFNDYSSTPKYGTSIRLFSNTPHLTTDKFESGLFATDISSTPKSIRIPFGCKVTNIKCVTSTNVTAIEAKLFNYAGTELETLITGKACNATTKSFNVTADQTVSYTDNYVRITGSGNGGVGMNIIVTIEPV